MHFTLTFPIIDNTPSIKERNTSIDFVNLKFDPIFQICLYESSMCTCTCPSLQNQFVTVKTDETGHSKVDLFFNKTKFRYCGKKVFAVFWFTGWVYTEKPSDSRFC